MSGQGERTRRAPGRSPNLADGSTEQLPRISLVRLLALGGVLLLAVATCQSVLCPFRVGWQRAAEVTALEDTFAALKTDRARVTEQLKYRDTEANKALEALKQFELGKPGARAVELAPKALAATRARRPTLGEQADRWRARARVSCYSRWRILARYLFDLRLPPPTPMATT